jgi:hypothetical protein
MESDVISILITVVLVLAALVGLGMVIALALLIKTVLELFALARTVRSEVKAVAGAVRSVGEKVTGTAEGVLGVFKPKKKPAKKVAR